MAWNPFFDWCSILLTPKPIPPKQRKSGPKNREFEDIVTTIHNLDVDRKWYPQNEWPWTGRLFVMLSFSGPREYLDHCDVDNLSKAALDAFKGIVYADDRQIDYLIAFKKASPFDWIPADKPSLTIGVKKIESDFTPVTIPSFFVASDKDDTTKHPSQIFIQINGKTLHFQFDDSITEKDFDSINKRVMAEIKGK